VRLSDLSLCTPVNAVLTRKTLYRVERGDPAVALGIYARVLQALRLENDLASIAVDDVLGRKLRDLNLEPKSRAPKRRAATAADTALPEVRPAAKGVKDKP